LLSKTIGVAETDQVKFVRVKSNFGRISIFKHTNLTPIDGNYVFKKKKSFKPKMVKLARAESNF
jgi:hypothetical protein